LQVFKKYFTDPTKRYRKKGCMQGNRIIRVSPNGDVYLCASMKSAGNIEENSIHDIWVSKNTAEIRQQMYDCRTNCLSIINCFFDDDKESWII